MLSTDPRAAPAALGDHPQVVTVAQGLIAASPGWAGVKDSALGWGTLGNTVLPALFFPQKRPWDRWIRPGVVGDAAWHQLGLCCPVPIPVQ